MNALAMLAERFGIRSVLGRDIGFSFGINLASTSLSFLVAVVLARLLGTEGFGIYSLAWTLVAVLALPSQAGLPMLVVRETAHGLASNQPGHVRGVWIWASRIAAGMSVGAAAVGGAVIAFAYAAPLGMQATTIAWALALVPLMALANLRGAALRGLRRIVAGQLPEFVVRPGLLLVFLCTVVITRNGISPATAMALHVVASVSAFAAGAWLLTRSTPRQIREAAPVFQSRRWLASALPLALIVGMQVVNQHAGILMLGVLEPVDQVGIYRVAAQIAVLAAFGLSALNTVLAPRFADLHARSDIERLQQIVTYGARVALACSLAVTFCFLAFGEPLLALVFGQSFAEAYLPLLILLVGQLVNSAAGSVGFLLNMTGHERDAAKGVAVTAFLNIALNLLLIPFWGILGAAAATSISMITWNALLWWAVRNRLGINSFAFNLGVRNPHAPS